MDRNLGGKRLKEALVRLDFDVEVHMDHFVDDSLDDVWIRDVAKRDWVIISGDKRIAKETDNIDAVIQSKARVLLVGDTNAKPEQWAASIIVGRDRIAELLNRNPGPVFIGIGQLAKDHIGLKHQDLLARRGARVATEQQPDEQSGDQTRAVENREGKGEPAKEL